MSTPQNSQTQNSDFEYIPFFDDGTCRKVYRGGYQGEQCISDNLCYEVYEAICITDYGDHIVVGSFIRRK